jgi:transcription-repair coupling factor (superfamily II helicase)
VPAAVDRLLKIARLRIIAAGRGVQAIEVAGDKVMITRGGEFVMRGNHFPRLKAKDASAKLDELIQLVRTLGT